MSNSVFAPAVNSVTELLMTSPDVSFFNENHPFQGVYQKFISLDGRGRSNSAAYDMVGDVSYAYTDLMASEQELIVLGPAQTECDCGDPDDCICNFESKSTQGFRLTPSQWDNLRAGVNCLQYYAADPVVQKAHEICLGIESKIHEDKKGGGAYIQAFDYKEVRQNMEILMTLIVFYAGVEGLCMDLSIENKDLMIS